jgi:hypothetical protein
MTTTGKIMRRELRKMEIEKKRERIEWDADKRRCTDLDLQKTSQGYLKFPSIALLDGEGKGGEFRIHPPLSSPEEDIHT